MPDDFRFDVFLSHSAKDKPMVRELAARLNKNGVRVWLDEEQIKPGDNIPAKVEEGLAEDRYSSDAAPHQYGGWSKSYCTRYIPLAFPDTKPETVSMSDSITVMVCHHFARAAWGSYFHTGQRATAGKFGAFRAQAVGTGTCRWPASVQS